MKTQKTGQKNNTQRRLLRLTLFLIAAVLLAACTSATGGATDEFAAIPLDQFPDGLGRGYPVADLVQESSANVGDPAPNFAFLLEDGRGADLASLQGRPVVINFWATWCGPCRAEMPELVELHETNPDVVVLEVNVQEELPAIQGFAEEFEMTMPVIVDPPGAIRKAYDVRNMPTTVFVNPDGTIGVRWAGILLGEQLTEFVDQVSVQ